MRHLMGSEMFGLMLDSTGSSGFLFFIFYFLELLFLAGFLFLAP